MKKVSFIKAALCLVFIMFAPVLLAEAASEKVLFFDDFNNLDPTLWSMPAGTSKPGHTASGATAKDGNLSLLQTDAFVHGMSMDRFSYGTLELKLRLIGSKNADYYLGFMNRDNWGHSNLMMQTHRNHAFVLNSRKNGGEGASIASTGPLETDKWYIIKILWQPDRAELFLDGKSCGLTTDPTKIPDAFMPTIIDLVVLQEQAGMDIDWIKVTSEKKITQIPPQIEMTLPANKNLNFAEPDLPNMNPVITVKENGAILENTYYRCLLSWEKGFTLKQIFNKSIQSDCLNDTSRFFSVTVNGKRIDSTDFKVIKAEVTKSKPHKVVMLVSLESKDAALAANLEFAATAFAEFTCDLSIHNTGRDNLNVSVLFPLIENIDIGGNLRENYYYFPFEGGYCGNAVFDMRAEYGGVAPMQLLDIYNRRSGGGIYTYPKDQTGTFKTLILRKVEKENTVPPVYRVCLCQKNNPGDIFSLKPGLVMAINNLEDKLAPGDEYELAPVAFGIHYGDWKRPLAKYSNWVHIWYKPVKTPRWYKDYFNRMSVHDYSGNFGLEKGFYSKEKKRYIFAETMQPERLDHVSEWAYWWDHPEDTNIVSWSLRNGNMGDYYYPKNRGGLKPLKKEIAKIHAKGGRVILYMEITQCWRGTDIGKAHGKEWARMDSPGYYNRDYCIEPNDGWIVCPYVPGWQDHIAKRFAKVIKDTGADGLRLDRGISMYPCFNAEHNHYKGTLKSTLPTEAMVSLLKKVTNAVKAVNPQAVVEGEGFASDYLAQFIDGSLDHKHAYSAAGYADKKTLNVYDINFWRFYFPGRKHYFWGQSLEHDGSKRGFFNGMSVERSGSFTLTKQQCEEETRYLAKVARLYMENGDAFNTLKPQPLVPTEKDYVYANKFPLVSKTLHTLYNRNSFAVKGPMLTANHKNGFHFVELFYDNELSSQRNKGKDSVDVNIEPADVVCIAHLPKILSVKQIPDTLEINLKRKIKTAELLVLAGKDILANQKKIKIKKGKAKFSLAGIEKGQKIIVKLLEEGYLVDEVVTFKQ